MDTTSRGTNDTQLHQVDGYDVPADPSEAQDAPRFNDDHRVRVGQYDNFHRQQFEAMADRAEHGEPLITGVLPYPEPPVDPMEALQCDSCQ
ncbi:hypothetical protein ACPPVW_18485 [Leifsonia sp. McL0607]|uniref:hypothetical protein n=1 Tax=Leifsonia sp. McL0607 TaxID=3415672 RepID=UPI003CEAB40F